MKKVLKAIIKFGWKMAQPLLRAAGHDPMDIRSLLGTRPIIHGGPKVRLRSWPVRRHIGAAEEAAVISLFRKERQCPGAISYQSAEEAAYCREFCEFQGGGFADAVNSGSSALYVALRSLDLEPFSEVIVPPVSDPGGIMPVPLLNCIPVPCDSRARSLNTGPEEIAACITPRTRAIIVTHVAGIPVDMDPVMELAARHNLFVVEDCAQAHGTLYHGKKAGTLGHISAFSTMFGKLHTTGGQGGLVYTCDPELYKRARHVADRGKPFDVTGADGNVICSLNLNQDEISCVIGRVQLRKLPQILEKRRTLAEHLKQRISGIPEISLPIPETDHASAHWFLPIYLETLNLRCTKEQFVLALTQEGIGGLMIGYGFIPCDNTWHRDRVVFGTSGLPWKPTGDNSVDHYPKTYKLPNVHAAVEQIFCLWLHENLSIKEMDDLTLALQKTTAFYRI